MEPSVVLRTAIEAIALGLGLLALVWAGLRLAARSQAWGPARVPSPVTLPLEHQAAEAGVLMADPGGRLRFINDRARRLFELGGATPTLWQLLRKAEPSQALETLFVAEGRTSLNIGERHIEATSLRVSEEDAAAEFVITLRETSTSQRVDLDLTDPSTRTTQALSFLAELNRTLAANPDMGATLDAVASCLGRVFQYNSAEITLWNEAAQVLWPARHAGSRDYERELGKTGRLTYRLGEGFPGWLATHRAPLLIGDIPTFTQARPAVETAQFPARSFLGAPMLMSDQLIGTLGVMSFKVNAYRKSDEFLMELIAGQAANAIQTAQRFAEQQRRMQELKALTDITRAIESTADPHELYARLTADIARLMDVQIVGLLLFDPAQNILVSQPPFHGIPDIIAVLYQILIPSGSQVERLWQANQAWLSNAVADDPDVDAAGLRQVAEAVGIRTSLLAPISVGGRKVGAVHLCNKGKAAAPFTDADARLVLTFAGQAAAILDNARLVGEAKARAEQADGLREIATLLASSTDLNEVLQRAMQRGAVLLHFDAGFISLLDEARGELAPHPASLYGLFAERAQPVHFYTHEADYARSITRQRRTWLAGSLLSDEPDEATSPVSPLYRRALEPLKLDSAMGVPLLIGDRCLGEVLVAARREEAFGRADLQLLVTVAAQLASGIERVQLYASTDQDLRRRVDQLTALSRVSREMNQTLVVETLLRVVGDEARRVTRADCSSIVLLAPPSAAGTQAAALRIGDEELGGQLTPLEAEVVAAARGAQAPLEPRLVTDMASAAAPHPGVRSALIVPIVTGGVLAGLLHLHSRQTAGFDAAAQEIAAALAAQTAIGVANAQRFEDQQKRSQLMSRRAEQLSQLLMIAHTVRSNLPVAANLETVAAGIWESMDFKVVLISVLDPQTKQLTRTASAGMPLETFEIIKKVEQPWDNVARLFKDEFRLGRSYFVPHGQLEAAAAYLDIVPTPGPTPPAKTADAWQRGDLFLVPLIGSQDEPVGLLALDDPVDGVRPDLNTAELAEIFANQAALVIENSRLYQASERRAARLLALHRVIEQADRVADRNQRWQAVAEALLSELGLDVCLIALVDFGAQALDPSRPCFILQGKAGNVSPGINLAPMFATLLAATPEAEGVVWSRVEKAPDLAGEAYAPHLVLDVTTSTVWANHPLILATHAAAFVTTPIVSQGKLVGLLFAGACALPSPFMPEDLDLFGTLANQLGAALESARLQAGALAERSARAAQLTALSEVSRLITAALRTDDVVRTVIENLQRVIPYDSATLWLRSTRAKTPQLRIAAAQGFENNAEQVGLTVDIADSALFAEMAQTGGAIIVPDVRMDPRFPASAFLPTRTWLGAPLISKSEILGALVLDKVEPEAYSPQIAQVLVAFANQTAIALENARLFEESEQHTAELDERSQRLALLNRISIQLSSTLNEYRLYEVAVTEMALALNVPQAVIVAFDDEGKTRVATRLPVYSALPEGIDQTPAIMRAYGTLKPVAVEDVSQDLLLTKTRDIFTARDVKSLLVIPMSVAGTPVAAIQLEETSAPRRFTPEEVELAQTLANEAAVAVQNARLYNETQVRLNELITLNRVSQALASTINLEQVYQTVREQIMAVMGVDNVYLALYDEVHNLVSFPFIVQRGKRLSQEAQPPSGLTGRIIETRQPLLLRGDAYAIQQQLKKLDARQVGEGAARSYLGVPLIIGERIIGVLAVQDLERSDALTPTHERLLTILGAQVAVTVENARFAQELEARVAARTQDLDRARVRMETLLNITTELSASLDLELVLARTLELVTAAVKAPQGSIYLIDDNDPTQLIYRAALGGKKPLRAGGEPSPFKRNQGLIGWVIRNRQGTISGDVDNDPRWTRIPGRTDMAKSALAVPLMMGEEVQGGMILLSSQPDAFDEEQLRLVTAAANQVGAAINNARLYKMIEDLNRETGQALREQMVEASKSRSILEGIADGVMVTDERGVVILFNVACERILGLQRSQVVGQPATKFVGIYGAAGQTWLDAITQWSRDPSGHPTGDYFSEQVTLDNKRIISVHLSPVATGKEYLGSVSVIRDITREVEVDRLKSEFVTNVSHELRTPMSAVKGYADILLMGAAGPMAPQQEKFLQVIKSNADRLGGLLNDLLDISRIDSGRVELMKQPISIRGVLKTVQDVLQGRGLQHGKPLTVEVDAPEDLPQVSADRQRLTQLVLALADNAYHYSEANATIRLSASVVGETVQVEVSDTGVGMSPNEQKRLFDRFYRGENPLVLRTPGNGLGLAMARQLAEMHNGKVWLVRSELGKGSTFAVSLPLG